MLRPAAVVLLLHATVASAYETVRISIATEHGPVTISADTLAFGPDKEDAVFTPAPSRAMQVRLAHGRLLVDGQPWTDGEAVRFRVGASTPPAGDAPASTSTSTSTSAQAQAQAAARAPAPPPPERIRAAGVEVRGDVVIRVQRNRLLVVNVIDLEDYLAAVLGSEMPRSFPDEALRAQAVAARTYALHKKLEAYDAPFHLGSSVLHQVYAGVEREDPRTRAAVEATRGEVLTFELAPIEAYFHASCGGRTETGFSALSRELPYLRSVDCPCGELAASRWSAAIPLAELRAAFPGADRLVVTGKTRTGRARRVQLSPSLETDGVELRRKLGYSRLKSLTFASALSTDGVFSVEGRGSGHGAGLCQWGAKAYADQGWGYREILAHYYPGAELQKLY